MTFQHGITFTYGGVLGTRVRVGGNLLPTFIGTAYGPTEGDAPLTSRKISSLEQYVSVFGWGNRDEADPDTSAVNHNYTLDEIAWLFFKVYKTGPIVCLNVFDGTVHQSGEPGSLVPDVAEVVAADIVAACDLVEPGMATIGYVPSNIGAPRWSQVAAVKTALGLLNQIGPFRPLIHVDLLDDPDDDDEEAKIAAVIEADALTREGMFPCWPEVGGFALSGIASAALHKHVVEKMDGIPAATPSSKQILVSRLEEDRTVLHSWLNVLNEGRVCTIRTVGSKQFLWGTWLSPYAGFGGTADYINDTYMPYAIYAYFLERVAVNFAEYVDDPLNLRLIEDVVAKMNDFGSQLQGRQAVLGFNVAFLESENPISELTAGRIRLSVTMLPAREATEINFQILIDLNMFSSLYGNGGE